MKKCITECISTKYFYSANLKHIILLWGCRIYFMIVKSAFRKDKNKGHKNRDKKYLVKKKL